MKKCVFILSVATVVLFVFTACGLERGAETPTDEEIETAYQNAVEAYIWFDMETMPALMDDVALDENGNTFFKVNHDEINTFAGLEAYLQGIFTEDIVSYLLDRQLYRDFDGTLYVMGGSRGGDITRGAETHEIVRESDQRIIYRVTVDILDWDTLEEVIDTVAYDFDYILVDGNWLFANFNLTR